VNGISAEDIEQDGRVDGGVMRNQLAMAFQSRGGRSTTIDLSAETMRL